MYLQKVLPFVSFNVAEKLTLLVDIVKIKFASFPFQSAVMSATFAKFHPNLVVGGTYSGQIVLWDNRSNKRTPVQRTPLSAAAHTVGRGGGVENHPKEVIAY